MSENSSDTKASPSAKPKKRRRLLKALAILLVLFVAVVVFLPYLVPNAWLVSVAEQGLQAAVARPVKMGKVSWGWLSGVSVGDVSVSELDKYGGGDLLSAKGISFKADLWDLVRSRGREINVRSITIESPHVRIVLAADGGWNFDELASPRKPRPARGIVAAGMLPAAAASPPSWSIAAVRVEDGSVTFVDLGRDVTVEIDEIDAEVKADFSQSVIAGSAEVSLALVQPGGKGRIELTARKFQVDKSLSAEALEGASAAGTLKLDGIELSQVTAAVPGLSRELVSGRLTIEAAFDVRDRKADIETANARLRQLNLGKDVLQPAGAEIGDVEFGFSITASQTETAKSVDVKNFQVKTDFAELSASVSFDRVAQKAQWKALLDAGGLDLTDYVVAEEKVIISGRVESGGFFLPGETEGTNEFSADTRFDALSIDLPSAEGTEVELEGTLVAATKRVATDNLMLRLGGEPLSIKAAIKTPLEKPTGTITLRAARADADKLTALAGALAEAFGTQEAAPEAKAAAKDARPAGANAYLSAANVTLDVKIDSVTYENYSGRNLVVDAGLAGGKAVLRKSSVDIFGGTAGLSAQADISKDTMPLEARINVARLEAGEPARELLGKLLPELDFTGTMNLDFALSGSLAGTSEEIAKSLTGEGTLLGENGVLSLTQLPLGLSALFKKELDLDARVFSKLDGDLRLAQEALQSACVIADEDYTVYVDGTTRFDGGFIQKVSVSIEDNPTKIFLFSNENGRFAFAKAEDVLRMLAEYGIKDLLKEKLKLPDGEGDAKKEEILDAVDGVLNIITKSIEDRKAKDDSK